MKSDGSGRVGNWSSGAAKLALGAAMLASGTGCSALTAITNPRAAWALGEPAPIAVVLRRGDAARATATNVDRLMGSTPVDASSRWVRRLNVKKPDAEAMLRDIGADPDYLVPGGTRIRVVQAEAWAKVLSSVCPSESRYRSLFASVHPDVGAAYSGVSADAELLASLKESRADEQTMIDDTDVPLSDKDEHRKKKQEIDEAIDKAQADYRTNLDAFFAKLREGADKAPADVKKQMPVVLVALKHAIDDAKLANSAAMVRYPLALPQMPQDLKEQAKRILAGTVEERTGHRPNLANADPQVTFEDGEVRLTLAGLPPEALGGLKSDALVKDVLSRTETYVERVITFPSYVAETQDMLDLQSEIVRAAMDDFEVDESKTVAGDDLGDLEVTIAQTEGGAAKGRPHAVPMYACGKAEPKEEAGDDTADAADDGDAGDAGDDADGKKHKAKAHKEKDHKEKGHKEAKKAKKAHHKSALTRAKLKSHSKGAVARSAASAPRSHHR